MIENLSEFLIGLLGRAEDDPIFTQLACDVGDPCHETDFLGMRVCLYSWGASITFRYELVTNRICSQITFYGLPASESTVAGYEQALPFGITISDERDIIASKIGHTPKALNGIVIVDSQLTKGYTEIFEVGGLEFNFRFDNLTHRLRKLEITRLDPLDDSERVYII